MGYRHKYVAVILLSLTGLPLQFFCTFESLAEVLFEFKLYSVHTECPTKYAESNCAIYDAFG